MKWPPVGGLREATGTHAFIYYYTYVKNAKQVSCSMLLVRLNLVVGFHLHTFYKRQCGHGGIGARETAEFASF